FLDNACFLFTRLKGKARHAPAASKEKNARHTAQNMHITRIFTTVERVLSNLLAIFFALASALTVAWGTVIRHRIALD
ncbi:hypothetical protein K3W00_14845, partial [Listeria monocytogenes]|nr:hypothetical protein [Listeria monocytogenes]